MKKVIFLLAIGFASCAFKASKDETELDSDSLPKSKVCADIEPTQLMNGGNDTIQYVNELLLAQENKSNDKKEIAEVKPLKLFKSSIKATYYASHFEKKNKSGKAKLTASGEKYDKNKLTAAHNSLPFGTKVLVTNLKNNKSVEVIINDRGGKKLGIDLTPSAMKQILPDLSEGVAKVKIEIIKLGNNKPNVL